MAVRELESVCKRGARVRVADVLMLDLEVARACWAECDIADTTETCWDLEQMRFRSGPAETQVDACSDLVPERL